MFLIFLKQVLVFKIYMTCQKQTILNKEEKMQHII